ncbi:MAG: PilW family protein [Gammaproteobacteria bacterium]|nr:PilW family protein [Gammaproteobacteria bacterium]
MEARLRRRAAATPHRAAGVTLIELMVALAIGSFLLIGAVSVFVQSRQTFRVTESVSRLQENARFALFALEPDVRMAHYWGLTSRTGKIAGQAGPADPPSGFPVANDCGQNWAVDLETELGGANNGYDWACAANGGAQPGADTLIVRRVETEPVTALEDGTLYVQSARFQDGQLFLGNALPAAFSAATSETHRLVVNGYYVSPTSSLSTPDNPVPSLRVKKLTGTAAGPRITDEEVLPGVEDLQIQFGIDTDALGAANRGAIDAYVNPGDPSLGQPDVAVLAVRIWLRLRTERPETGFTDTNAYRYADRDSAPPRDGFRRIVVSKTVYVRNARPPA